MWNRSLLYLAFFLYHLRSTIAGGSPPPYVPDDHIFLACGSSVNSSDVYGRVWTGDVNSKYFRHELPQNHASVNASTNLVNSAAAKAPYKNARISFSAFTYAFPVSAGAKFIRLYFYSTGYPGYPRSNPIFSVKSGPFILLSNFSLADFGSEDTVYREYCVKALKNRMLHITFTPSADNSFAFINGIEIVSMPPYLYYTSPNAMQNTLLFWYRHLMTLETVYRVNVGGTAISPREDTGMFRRWSMDDDYVAHSQQVILVHNSSVELKFTKVPAYTAPGEVYRTARTTGNNSTRNLTWNFPVDSGFSYLVRLHFCEFRPKIVGANDRMFHIFISDEEVESLADVIGWSGGSSVPVYREYPVWMPDREVSYFGDGSNPRRYPPLRTKHNRTTIVVVVGCGIFGFAVLLVLWCLKLRRGPLVLWFLKFRRGKHAKDSSSRIKSTKTRKSFLKFRRGKSAKDSSSLIKSMKTRKSSPLFVFCHHFSLAKIKAATDNFDQALIIGVGGFGNVYKGLIDGGTNLVAIKRLTPGSHQGAHEFKTEIQILSQLRHRHLVSLIGYCDDDNEMILVYDYMARGTLRYYLCNTDHSPLTWKQRLQICIGAARGLNYLHTGWNHEIIHRDVKTTNILLDEKWVAKVSDFGLSKVGPSGTANTHISTIVKGTPGYLDPEYFRLQQLTQKSDVYSFGVVLFEVLCAKPPIFRTKEMQVVSLANWVSECYHNGVLDQIIDPSLSGKIALECLMKFVEIAVNCLHDNGTKRPSMNDVLRELELALQLQEGVDHELMLDKVGESNGIYCSNNGQDFSELMSPKGR